MKHSSFYSIVLFDANLDWQAIMREVVLPVHHSQLEYLLFRGYAWQSEVDVKFDIERCIE